MSWRPPKESKPRIYVLDYRAPDRRYLARCVKLFLLVGVVILVGYGLGLIWEYWIERILRSILIGN